MKKLIVSLIVPTVMGVVALTNYNFHRQNEVYVEAKGSEGVEVEKALAPRMYRANDLADYSVAVRFDYDSYEADSAAIEEGERTEVIAESSKYHYGINKQYATSVDLAYDSVFVSKYSPLVIYSLNDTSLEDVLTKVEALSYTSKIHDIHVYDRSLFEAKVDDEYLNLETDAGTPTAIDGGGIGGGTTPDLRDIPYDNFPNGSLYKGAGIKVGIFDVGLFDVNHDNFSGKTVQVVYDTNTSNNIGSTAMHPTWIGSIIGGKYGIASSASLYFADLNGGDSYAGIERLIDAGCDLVNMSVSIFSVTSTTYNTDVEYYFDYIYTSTKVVMVAASGNSLNEYGQNGYVGLPALCANVITVGSYDDTGSPSDFSSYKHANDVLNKPNLVAIGDHRVVPGFSAMSGTSLSAPAVTGALALLFQKRGVLDMPTSLSLLEASANNAIVSKDTEVIDLLAYSYDYGMYLPTGETVTCTNREVAGLGFYERSGAGALDIAKLLTTSSDYTPAALSMTSTNYITLVSGIYLTVGQTLTAVISWERTGRVYEKYFLGILLSRTFSHDALANLDLAIVSASGAVWKTSYASSNSEMMRFSSSFNGYFSIKVKPVSNYSAVSSVNYAYRVV